MASEMVIIGKILAPFGVQGAVKVMPYSDHLERCYLLKRVKLEGAAVCEFKQVSKASIHQNMWLLHFIDCHTRDEAILLKNSLVKIHHSERLPLPEGHYYFDQVIGLEVYTAEGHYLGKIQDVLQPGGNDVYHVKNDFDNSEALIPALEKVVKEINLEENKMIIEPLPGLLDE